MEGVGKQRPPHSCPSTHYLTLKSGVGKRGNFCDCSTIYPPSNSIPPPLFHLMVPSLCKINKHTLSHQGWGHWALNPQTQLVRAGLGTELGNHLEYWTLYNTAYHHTAYHHTAHSSRRQGISLCA
jgi:hypothetical protein